jgi:hypothetical protein
MLHLDEGTVHAWLDGELPPDDAAHAARHVAACAECQALVAEARGLMAGASRIVSALDAGPAGVIPPAQRGPSSGRRAWRRFAFTPVRMSIAATIIVAAGLTFTARRAADNSSLRGRMIDSPINPATQTARAAATDSFAPAPAAATAGKQKTAAKEPASIGSADLSSPKPVASPAPRVIDAPALEQKAALADKRAVTEPQRQVAAGAPTPASSPLMARVDSLRAKDEVAKLDAESLSKAQAFERRREALAGGNASQIRGVAINQRDAEPRSVVVLRECYRLAVDSTDWRGVLPSAFALDVSSSGFRAGQGVSAAGQGSAGSVTAPRAAQSANTVVQFSSPATNPVHALAPSGRLDSRVIGFWFALRADTVGVRFAAAEPNKAITVLIAGSSPIARVTSSDRTDSVRVARAPCVP